MLRCQGPLSLLWQAYNKCVFIQVKVDFFQEHLKQRAGLARKATFGEGALVGPPLGPILVLIQKKKMRPEALAPFYKPLPQHGHGAGNVCPSWLWLPALLAWVCICLFPKPGK